MKYLADTHMLIWALRDDPKLSEKCRKILLNADNTIFFSIVNIWGVGLKYALHKENFTVEHMFAMEFLKRSEDAPRHRDLFGRLLLAQAKTERMYFISHDSLLKDYNEPVLLVYDVLSTMD